jgi:hypothetical protein
LDGRSTSHSEWTGLAMPLNCIKRWHDAQLLDGSAPGDELKDDCDDGSKKQQMDEPTCDVKGHKAHCPQHQKHDGDGEKHVVILVPVCDVGMLLGPHPR